MIIKRHLQSKNNELGGILNFGDPAITKHGRNPGREYLANIAALDEVELILSSPALRARQSAKIDKLYLPKPVPIVVLPGLAELRWGNKAKGRKISELFTDEVEDRARAEGIDFRLFPDSETYAEVHDRMRRALEPYADAGPRVIVETHSTSAKNLIGIELGENRAQIRNRPLANGEALGFDLLSPAEPLRLFEPDPPAVSI